jgi:AcrR family transcriptional regulator
VRDLEPRKRPRQARSQASFDAVVEACARLLPELGFSGITTNHIAERAGVSIGTLYEFFPNKDAIVAALLRRRFEEALALVERSLRDADRGQTDLDGLVRNLIGHVAAERDLHRVLAHEVPFASDLPETREALERIFELTAAALVRATGVGSLSDPDAAAWLVARMVHHAAIEIATLAAGEPAREARIAALVALVRRMLGSRGEPGAR